MHMQGGTVFLKDGIRSSPRLNGEYSTYTDVDGNKIAIPNLVIVGIYELLRFEAKRLGKDFDKWCDGLFESREEKRRV